MAKTAYTIKGNTARLDSLFTSTFDKRQKEKVDQIFYEKPALAWLLQRKDTDLLGDGGQQFLVPMLIEENPNGGMIDEEEGVSMNDFDPDTMAVYWAKTAAYGVRWSRSERRINRGSSRIYSLIEHKIDVTVKSMQNTLSQQLWSGTGSGKNSNSLTTLIPATVPASQSTSIGGQSPSTYAWWRTQAINMTGLSAASDLEDKMLQMYNTIEDETGPPNTIFTDKTTQEIYEKNQLDFVVATNTKIGDANFNLVKYKGLPLIRDKDANAGEMRFITDSAIKFCVDPMYWFEWTEWKESLNLPFTTFKQLVCVFNIARRSARNLGCIFNISE